MKRDAATRAIADPAEQTAHAFREFGDRLRGFVARRVSRRADADDIVQGVYVRMFESLRSHGGISDLGAWLFAAARNAIVDDYRSAWRRRERTAGDTRELRDRQAATSGPAGAEAGGGDASAVACLRPLLHLLSETDRRALEKVDLEGMTQRGAAQSEGLSLPGMKARVQRARRRLEETLLRCCRIGRDRRGGLLSCEPKAAPQDRSCRGRGPEGCST